MSVDGDAASSHFSPVADRRAVDVSVFSPEKFLNPDRGEFVMEEDNISDLRDGSLLFPCYSWSSPGVLLSPERIEEVQDDFPTGELMLDRNIRVDQ